MFLARTGVIAGTYISPCTDADVIAFILATGISDPTINTALCTLVTSAKANGWWDLCSAIYPMVGGLEETCKYNLKDPRDLDAAYRLTFVNSPTFSATGVDWNGTDEYARTFLNASILSNAHLSYYSRENVNTGADQIDIGGNDGSTTLWLSCYYNASGFTNPLSRNCSTSVLLSGANATAAAYFMTSKTGTTNVLYKNGASEDSDVDAAATPNAEIYLGAFNNAGAPEFRTNRECAFATIGDGVDATMAADMYTDIQAFQTTLSRQV